MKKLVSILLTLCFPVTLLAADNLNLSRKGIAVDGYDLVSYHQSGPVKGSNSNNLEYMSATYYFSNLENLELFQANPEKYLPEYGGYCAYAMLEGNLVNIDPESYKIVDGKLYLYYDGLFGDTLKKWNELIQTQDEASLISTTDSNWQAILQSE